MRDVEMRFLVKYPFLSDKIVYLRQIALRKMDEDYRSGGLKGDYEEYLVKAWETYKSAIENEAKRIQRIPVIRKKEESEEQFYTIDDYHDWYIHDYMPKIKRKGVFVENVRYDRGFEEREIMPGRWKGQGVSLQEKEEGREGNE